MPAPARAPSDAELEELLRTALNARSAQISERDLRPAQPPALPVQTRKQSQPGRRRPLALTLAAAAVGILILGGVQVVSQLGRSTTPPVAGRPPTGTPSSGPRVGAPTHLATAPPTGPDGPRYPVEIIGGAEGDQKVRLSFTWGAGPVPGTAARTTYPMVAISGADPDLQRHLKDTITSRINALIDRYRARLRSEGLTARPVTQEISIRADTRWQHTVSIILDDLQDDGTTPPVTTSTAVVLDPRTGREVTAVDLFPNVDAVDALMRKEIRKEMRNVTPPLPVTTRALAALSMRPGKDGSTRPLTWFTTPEGLHWVIDPGVIAAADQGQLTAELGWSQLAALLPPNLR